MNVIPIPPEHVDEVWPVVGPLIHRSCLYSCGLENAEDLRQRVKDGRGCVLVMIDTDTAVILEREGDLLHVVSMGGRNIIGRIGDVVAAWWKIASHVGCAGLSLRGRKGWNRILSRHGFVDAGNGFMEARQ